MLIVEHCSFEYMRERADKMAPFGGAHMSSAKSFFHKGPSGISVCELTVEHIQRYNRKALEKLGSECAHWLETGQLDNAAGARAKVSLPGVFA